MSLYKQLPIDVHWSEAIMLVTEWRNEINNAYDLNYNNRKRVERQLVSGHAL